MLGRSASSGLRLPRRLAGATTLSSVSPSATVGYAFCFVEKGELRRSRGSCLLGLTSEKALTQQRLFLFKKTDPRLHLRKHLLEMLKILGEVLGHGIHALDYPESGHESRRQSLMGTITPEVKTVEHLVEFLDSQDNCFVRHVGRRLETFGLQSA